MAVVVMGPFFSLGWINSSEATSENLLSQLILRPASTIGYVWSGEVQASPGDIGVGEGQERNQGVPSLTWS